MTKYTIEAGSEVAGNTNYVVCNTGEYELLELVPCRLKTEDTESTCAFLTATVLGIEETN